MISEGQGSNLLAVLLLYLEVLDVILVWLKLITISIVKEQVTRVDKTVKDVHVRGITSKLVVIPLWTNLVDWLSQSTAILNLITRLRIVVRLALLWKWKLIQRSVCRRAVLWLSTCGGRAALII